MRTRITVALIAVFALTFGTSVYAAEKKETAKPATPATAPAATAAKMPVAPAARPNFNVLFGTVTKINASNPAKVTIEVNNERDGKAHTLEVTPMTNLAKITDIGELKTGDAVRIMSRTTDNQEVAVNVVFGKIKNPPPPPKPATPAPAAAAKK